MDGPARHDLVEEITDALVAEFPEIDVTCHVEPVEDPRSYEHVVG